MARTLYDPNKNYLELANEYLESCGREQTKLPKVSEFCREYLKVSQDAVDIWMKDEKKENVIVAIKRIKEAQMEQLMDDGLYGGKEVNNAMAIFLLKANHGMIETERRELVGKDGAALGVVVLPELNEKLPNDKTTNNLESPKGSAN